MKCIIFGGAGFLGEHLGKALIENGHEVVVYDRASEKVETLKEKYPTINYQTGDFNSENNFNEIIDSNEIIFHLRQIDRSRKSAMAPAALTRKARHA